jgi:hypothetical protein
VLGFFVLGVVVLAGLLLIGRWYVSAEPRQILRVGTWFGLALGVSLAVFLAVTGRLWMAAAIASAALPWLLRLIRAARTARNYARMAGIGGDGASTIRTRLLNMTLDHRSGALDGTVVDGAFAGRTLGDLSPAELFRLLDECRREDRQSVQVLEAYLDRTRPDWRTEAAAEAGDRTNGAGDGAPPSAMTREEAYRILGLEPGADEAEIREAHRRLITILHPDRGGSPSLAAQVNRARDVLLAR